VGLLVACATLPLFDTDALRHYWWVLLALPLLVALLHPRAITGLLDAAFRAFGRPPLNEHLAPHATLRAGAWSVASWIGFGAQLSVLCAATGPRGISTWLLCTGAMALAVSAGVIVIPAPAGAGIRDIILLLILRTIVSSGTALTLVLASRVLLIACDLLLAALAAALRPQAFSSRDGDQTPSRGPGVVSSRATANSTLAEGGRP
jgi:glycosyltransferase 2 family protein